ncbi:DNA topoisomerase VI subunit B [Candidatus Bathyarchaeota archaeon]|nr:DNA topoisomerase VI subunit B [Candidatus Bathyarchaeota archaeon]
MSRQEFREISPSEFFYRHREIVGFTNPARAVYTSIREFVENSLDAAESIGVPPDIHVSLIRDEGFEFEVYRLRVEDNGSGIPGEYIPYAFGKILYGSKHTLKQMRGIFGLGGKMAILYGQITTNRPVHIISSIGDRYIYEYRLLIDIEKNNPIIVERNVHRNGSPRWRGTIIEIFLEGDYQRSSIKIIEYFKETAMANPYAELTFIDPYGILYTFMRSTRRLPASSREVKPHPHGVDVETLRKMINSTNCKTLREFLIENFHRVGEATTDKFLKKYSLDPARDPASLTPSEIVDLAYALKNFDEFLPPDPSCLSPLGEELLVEGVKKELNPEFVTAIQRKPSTYSGYPFIVEVALAYGGGIPQTGRITLYRFANKIPLLYDESSDVSWKVVNQIIDWKHYKIDPAKDPIAVIVHICSTRIPYRTLGKEFIADRPEIEAEITRAIRIAARRLSEYLSHKRRVEKAREYFSIYEKYLRKIARFSSMLTGMSEPDVSRLLRRVKKWRGSKDIEGSL